MKKIYDRVKVREGFRSIFVRRCREYTNTEKIGNFNEFVSKHIFNDNNDKKGRVRK